MRKRRDVYLATLLTGMAVVFLLADAALAARRDARAQVAQEVVALLVRRDFAAVARKFDGNLGSTLPADKLGQLWDAVAARAGAFQGQQAVRSEKAGESEVVIVTCAFEKSKADVKVVFNAAGSISGLFIVPNGSSPRASGPAPRETVRRDHRKAARVPVSIRRVPLR